MKPSHSFKVCCLTVGMLLSLTAHRPASAASPALAPLPQTLATHPGWPAAKNPGDVDSVDHLVSSLYDTISGPPGQRDWDRFRSLFLPDGRLGKVVPETPATQSDRAHEGDAVFLTPDTYARRDDAYFKGNGFFERSIANRVEVFGNLVQVWSTYESRNNKEDTQPFARGINSFQIVGARGHFWIANIFFDEERSGLSLPKKYLK